MENQNAQRVLDGLRGDATPFRALKSFSEKPGIYAVCLCGSEPLRICESLLQPGCLLYIGKTESSQQKRDGEQHFASGETGRSTLRRSLGALLMAQLGLVPQPRSLAEKSDRAFTHYKFDDVGEERLTSWMVHNLALSFYEYTESRVRIVELEEALISNAMPPLNIDKNPSNPYRQALKVARAECAVLAKNSGRPVQESPSDIQQIPTHKLLANRIYLHDAIVDVLKDCPEQEATSAVIAEEIRLRGMYVRPKDGMPPEAWQIKLRAGKPEYSRLFETLGGGKIRLRAGKNSDSRSE